MVIEAKKEIINLCPSKRNLIKVVINIDIYKYNGISSKN
jgi:hypothetical protein